MGQRIDRNDREVTSYGIIDLGTGFRHGEPRCRQRHVHACSRLIGRLPSVAVGRSGPDRRNHPTTKQSLCGGCGGRRRARPTEWSTEPIPTAGVVQARLRSSRVGAGA